MKTEPISKITNEQMILHWDREGNDCIWKLRCHCIQILHLDIYSVPKSEGWGIAPLTPVSYGPDVPLRFLSDYDVGKKPFVM